MRQNQKDNSVLPQKPKFSIYTLFQNLYQALRKLLERISNWVSSSLGMAKDPHIVLQSQPVSLVCAPAEASNKEKPTEPPLQQGEKGITFDIQEVPLNTQGEAEFAQAQEAQLQAEKTKQLLAQRQREAELAIAQETQLKAQREAELTQAQKAEIKAQKEAELAIAQETQLKTQREAELAQAQKAQKEAELATAQEAQLKAQREAELAQAQKAEIKKQKEAELATAQEAQLEAEKAKQLLAQRQKEAQLQVEAAQAKTNAAQAVREEALKKEQAEKTFLKNLCNAISQNNIEQTQSLLRDNTIKINLKLLAVSIIQNKFKIAELLIPHVESDINLPSTKEENIFLDTLMSAYVYGVDFRCRPAQNIIEAVWRTDRGPNPCSFSEKALLYAVKQEHVEMVELLLEQNIPLKSTDQIFENLVYDNGSYSATSKKILDLFFKKKMPIPINSLQHGSLRYAIQSGSIDIIEHTLISTQTELLHFIYHLQGYPEEFTEKPDSIVEYAIAYKQTDIAKLLISHYTKNKDLKLRNPILHDFHLFNAFIRALKQKNIEIAKLLFPLLDLTKINQRIKENFKKTHRTALYYAVESEEIEIIERLLEAGANYGQKAYTEAEITIIKKSSENLIENVSKNIITPVCELKILDTNSLSLVASYLTPSLPETPKAIKPK